MEKKRSVTAPTVRIVQGLHAPERRQIETLLALYRIPFEDCPDLTVMAEEGEKLTGTASLLNQRLAMVAVSPEKLRSGLVADLLNRIIEEGRRRNLPRLDVDLFPGKGLDLVQGPDLEARVSLTTAFIIALLDRYAEGEYSFIENTSQKGG